jgi:hypothetical protein
MGYVCPVCEDPQADGEHLANHLAFTAMLGDDDHEAWLDDHAPEWEELGPPALAERVTDHAAETDYPQVFEDTTDDGRDGHDHSHDQGHGHESGGGHQQGASGGLDGAPGGVADAEDLLAGEDVDPEGVLAEARELTRERRANAGQGDNGATEESDDTDGASGDAAE